MPSLALADTYRDLQRLDRARSGEALADEMLRSLRGIGVSYIVATLIPSRRTPPHERKKNLLIDRWPREWLDHYVRSNYVYIDPVYKQLAHGAARWSEAFSDCERPALQIMEGARECRLRDGITFTFPTADSATALVSVAGDAIDCDEKDAGRIALLAQYAVGKAICLAGESADEAAPKLTRRERDVLMWTCEGKTDWEIGTILGISEHCADKHLRGLKAKLKATSKPQLVARAFRLGLV